MPPPTSHKVPVVGLLAVLAVSVIVACCMVAALNKRMKSSWPW